MSWTEQALGLIETRGLVGAIEAADAGLKAAPVELLGTERVDAALVTVLFSGDTASVKAAVDAGAAAAEGGGGTPAAERRPPPRLEEMKVVELRHRARLTPDFPLKGRELSRANRDELLALFRRLGHAT